MSGHEIDSLMLFIHPPVAIAGYVFVFLFASALFLSHNKEKRVIRYLGLTTWLLIFSGLVTGMIWAQLAWGSYWSWDPKETSTLLLFVAVSASLASYHENKLKFATGISIISCLLSGITISTSFIIAGLHSFT
jgi:ABC-type transport system involved in cytochrome c biogenesis permease subunit